MSYSNIGFTGSQKGLTGEQYALIWHFLTQHQGNFHHGDCIGADQVAHKIAEDLKYYIIIHPPTNESKRAFCKGQETRPPKPYLQRNHEIVDSCNILIAAPKEKHEVLRSGTWATIRYARKKNVPVLIV